MRKFKKYLPAITFITGMIFGTGSIWQWKSSEIAALNHQLELVKTTKNLRNDLDELLKMSFLNLNLVGYIPKTKDVLLRRGK